MRGILGDRMRFYLYRLVSGVEGGWGTNGVKRLVWDGMEDDKVVQPFCFWCDRGGGIRIEIYINPSKLLLI